MMKIYICPKCGWIRLVSRRKDVECHKCEKSQMVLTNLELDKYSKMDEKQRADYAQAWMFIHSRNRG